jgi:3-hydroxyisobutyrate dehydrogenase-like beta-hydroxyacid dehydrogenase
MKIGFVGLGKMGSGMARNLLRAGHTVVVYNRSRDKAEQLTKDGATVVNSPAEAATGVEAVWTMLADDQAVDAVTWGKDGFGPALREGVPHISSSTISVSFSRKLAQEHARRGQQYISAPVFGRPEAAEAKKLIVITAGDQDVLQRFDALFEAIGRRTFHAGSDPTQANAVKLCGNFTIASMIETLSEALTTVSKTGVERQAFLDIMNELFGSPVYANYGKNIVERKFDSDSGFALKLGLKDIRQVVELAGEVESPMPIASLVRDHFVSAMANGQERMDWSSLELVSARNAGLADAAVKKQSA